MRRLGLLTATLAISALLTGAARAETAFFGQGALEDDVFPVAADFGGAFDDDALFGVDGLNDFDVGDSPPLNLAFSNPWGDDINTGVLQDAPGLTDDWSSFIDEGDNNPIFDTKYLRVGSSGSEAGPLSLNLDEAATGFGFYGAEIGPQGIQVEVSNAGAPVGSWWIEHDGSHDPFFWGVVTDADFDQVQIGTGDFGGFAIDAPRMWLAPVPPVNPMPGWYAPSNVDNSDFQDAGGSLNEWTAHTATSTDTAEAIDQGGGNYAAVLHAQGNDDGGGYARGETRIEQTVYIPLDATRVAFVYRTEETEGGTDDLEARVGLGRTWATQWDTLAEQADWTEGELVIEHHRKGKAREVQFEVVEGEGGSESGDWMELYADWIHVDGTPCDYSHAEWNSATGGDFNTPASWSTDEVPVNQWNGGETAFVKATDVTLADVGDAFTPVTVTGSHFVNEFWCNRGSETDPGLVIAPGGVLETWETAEVEDGGHMVVQPGGRYVAEQSFAVKYGGQAHLTGTGVRNDSGDIAVGHRAYIGRDGRLYVTDATFKADWGLSVYGDTSVAEFTSSDPGVTETVLLLKDVYIRGATVLFGEGTRTELDHNFQVRANSGAPANIQFDGTLYMGGDFLVEEGTDLTHVDFCNADVIFHNDADSELQVRGTEADPFNIGRLELESGDLTLVGDAAGYLHVGELVLSDPNSTLDLGEMTLEYGSFTGDEGQVENGTFVPEPATIGLLALGGLVGLRRRRR
ncbi:MAG: PEP-CTERM sorting domain-containing protein [Phycisphaerae bacterium]|nr:PEP-CTERM sorting domain-containing protein [Phycisphaerae bacterium]